MAEALLLLSNTTCGVRWLCVVEIANALRNKPSTPVLVFIDLLWCSVWQGRKLLIRGNGRWDCRTERDAGSAGSTTILLACDSDLAGARRSNLCSVNTQLERTPHYLTVYNIICITVSKRTGPSDMLSVSLWDCVIMGREITVLYVCGTLSEKRFKIVPFLSLGCYPKVLFYSYTGHNIVLYLLGTLLYLKELLCTLKATVKCLDP